MAQSSRPTLVSPRGGPPLLEAVRSMTGSWDAEAYHVMERRDETLIEEEILNGAQSSSFLYSFELQGKTVTGVSVIGARHLAAHYGGLKHRIVSSVRKKGSLFIFHSYASPGVPMQMSTASLPDLEQEDDFYSCVVEIEDIKQGNTIQIEKTENRQEWSERQKKYYDRPHYMTIAQSKAYRNGVLDLVPQDILIRWREEVRKLGKDVIITASIIDEKRSAVLRFSAARGLLVDRHALEELTLDQIAGLGDAARADNAAAFVTAARALGVELSQDTADESAPTGTAGDQQQQAPAPEGQQQHRRRGRPPAAAKEGTTAAQTAGQSQPPMQENAPGARTPSGAAGDPKPADPPPQHTRLF